MTIKGAVTFTKKNGNNTFTSPGLSYSHIIPSETTVTLTGAWYGGNLLSGYKVNFETNPITLYGNLIGGYQTNVQVNGSNAGVVILGRKSNISGAVSNLILGNESTKQSGNTINLIASNNVTLQSGSITNLIGGSNIDLTNISGCTNAILGSNCTIKLGGNLLAGANTILADTTPYQSGTVIIATLAEGNRIEDKSKKRYGLTLVGHGYSYQNPSKTNDLRYRIYFPDSTNYPAQLYGAIQYTDSMNVLDKDDNVIISNGKLNGHLLTDEEYDLFQKMKELINN